MKFYKSIVGVFLIIACSCGTDKKGGNFLKDGVSFTYPSGWSITSQSDLANEGFFLTVEKEGFTASASLSLTLIKGKLDASRYLEILKEEYGKQKVFDDLKFQSVRDNNFNGVEAVSSDYTFNTLGVKHKGIVYVFYKGENTYAVIKQEALKDVSGNKEGFDTIESTFKLE